MIKLDRRFKTEYGTGIYGLAVIGLLVIIIFASLVLGGAESAMSERDYKTLSTALNLLFQVANIAVIIIVLGKTRSKPDYFFSRKTKPIFYVAGFVLGLVSIFCFVAIAESGQILLGKIGYKLAEGYTTGIPMQDFFLLLVTVVAAPIAEEAIYRGALLTSLRRQFSPLISALLCAVAFSLMHMNPEQTIYQFCLGFGAAMLTQAAGSIIPAIIMHMTSNLIAALSMMEVRGFTDYFDFFERVFLGDTVGLVLSSIFLCALGFLIFIFGLTLLNKYFGSGEKWKLSLKRRGKKRGKEELAPIPLEQAEQTTQPEEVEQPKVEIEQAGTPRMLKRRARKGLFRNFTNTTMIYYCLTIGLTLLMWISMIVSNT